MPAKTWKTCRPSGWIISRWRRPRCSARFVPRKSFAWDATIVTTLPNLGNEVPVAPLIFFKPPSSLLAPGGQVRRPTVSERVDYEGELGVVIGKKCYQLGADEDVRPYILGYTCVNDVTARDLQNKDGQWTRAKGFDTFCPVGPLVTNEIDPWAGIGVETRVNGAVRQQGNTRDFIFPLEVVIRYISQVMTLDAGRPDSDRDAQGCRPGRGRRCHGSDNRGNGDIEESGVLNAGASVPLVQDLAQ